MPAESSSAIATIAQLLERGEATILSHWLEALQRTTDARLPRAEVEQHARDMLAALKQAGKDTQAGSLDAPAYDRLRAVLSDMSRTRARRGFTPSETAIFVFSLKEPLFRQLRSQQAATPGAAGDEVWHLNQLLDQMGLFTVEEYQHGREEVIRRQQEEIAELSTPVVKLWDGVLALPLIGTLDSSRTQVVMENLLQSIVTHAAEIAIIDITGVPTVDTLVAQHLLKTVAAARLMGADCIISGIRPQIAQTMVHLGVELNVVSKASLSDAFAVALARIGRGVVPLRTAAPRSSLLG